MKAKAPRSIDSRWNKSLLPEPGAPEWISRQAACGSRSSTRFQKVRGFPKEATQGPLQKVFAVVPGQEADAH